MKGIGFGARPKRPIDASSLSRFAAVLFASAGVSLAATASVLYKGGLQSGVFDLNGGPPNRIVEGEAGSGHPDTIILDGNLRVRNYRATPVYNNLCTDPEFGIVLETASGTLGRGGVADTGWTAAAVYPDNPVALDAVPSTGLYPLEEVKPGSTGVRIATLRMNDMCYVSAIDVAGGKDRILYFRSGPDQAARYGKLMILSLDIVVDTVIPRLNGPMLELKGVRFAYAMSDKPNLDAGPVVLAPERAFAKRAGSSRTLVWSEAHGLLVRDARKPGSFYDLTGKRWLIPELSR